MNSAGSSQERLATLWRNHVVICDQCMLAQAAFGEYCAEGARLTMAGGRKAAKLETEKQ